MNHNILDLPQKDIPTIDNKIGGPHTTPFLYTGLILMTLGSVLIPIPLAGMILSIPFFFSSSRVMVDINSKTWCKYWWVTGIRIGADNWKSLPPINAVTMIRVKETQTVASRGSQTTMSDYLYRVKLSCEGKITVDLLKADTREEALAKAEDIAASLKVKLVDYTDPDRKAPTNRRR